MDLSRLTLLVFYTSLHNLFIYGKPLIKNCIDHGDHEPEQSSQPNIIFMLADDMGWNDIGVTNPDIISPNLDHLATEGIFLNHSYVPPACAPSRAALLTGYYPFRNGLQHGVIHGTMPTGLSLKFPLVSDKLKALGYSTHMVGKWNMGYCDWKYTPLYRGFDSYFGMYQPTAYYYNHTSWVKDDNDELAYDLQNNTRVAWEYKGIHSSIPFVHRAQEVIESHDKSRPLFLFLSFQYVHVPHEVPKKYVDLYETSDVKNPDRRVFSGMVSALDDDIGKILSLLKIHGLYDNSIILFTSDNGGHPQSSGNNFPLRGAKGTLYEGGTRVPGFIHSPLLKKKGFVYDGMMHAVDWFSTMIGMAGGKPDDTNVDGIDMWESIQNNLTSPRKELVYNLDNYFGVLNAALRSGRWKLIVGEAGTPENWVPPENVTGDFRNSLAEIYPQFGPTKSTQVRLFDVESDPLETTELSATRPDIVRLLRQRLQCYVKEAVQASFGPHDPSGDPMKTGGAFVPGWCAALLDPSEYHPMIHVPVPEHV